MSSKIYILLLLFVFMKISIFSQTTNTKKWRKTENDSMQSALMMLDDGNYLMALPMYENLYNHHPKEEFLKYCYGKCALYRSDKHEMALTLIADVYNRNRKVENIEYDLARAYHYNYKFDEALSLIEKCIVNKRVSVETKKLASQLKIYCLNGKNFYANATDAKIENIGNVINTEYEEYVPVISADESLMLFTYRGVNSQGGLQNDILQSDPYGKYYEDIYESKKENGNWSKPLSLETVNTRSHDGAIALSVDGSYLFVYRDSGDDHGDIYMSNSLSGSWSEPQKLKGLVNTYSWEGSCSMTADGKQLYFSSERGGGFGGKDIYRATLLPDSTWGNIVNLGDTINTALDDDAPFIHPDGITLFYSSKGKNSMGGYDIFQSKLNRKDSTFSSPINLGYPINTTDEDIYYVLSANGERGYYASGKSGGFGLKDIYTVYPGYVGKKPSTYLVKGVLTENNIPIEAKVSVEVTDQNNRKFGEFNSNSINGHYLISLPSGGQFKLTYQFKGYSLKTLEVNTINLEGYDEKIFDVNFIPEPIIEPKKDSLSTLKDSAKVPPVLEPLASNSNLKPNSILQEKTKNYTTLYGDISAEGLQFRVQIAAYKFPINYVYNHLNGLGEVENLLLDDGITRITIGGSFPTLRKAYEHNLKVIEAGQKDAFVTMLYNGKRVFLEDLERLGIFIKK